VLPALLPVPEPILVCLCPVLVPAPAVLPVLLPVPEPILVPAPAVLPVLPNPGLKTVL
jgi:hypothetical protein